MKAILKRGIVIFGIVYLSASVLVAQVITGTIVGTAFDPSGAVVPGATITLRNMGTGYTRTLTTDSAGNYVFSELPAGVYSIIAKASGMQTMIVKPITLQVSQGTRANIHFTLGTTAQEVTVTAPGIMLDTQTSSQGLTITEHTIEALPLNGRDFLQLATLTAGVQTGSGDVGNARGTQGIDISGGRHDQNSYMIDGVDVTALQLGNVSLLLSPDAIQEFKILENNFDARFGQASGIVDVLTKSGTNAFHGSVYEFIRNNHLDANPFFNNFAGIKLPQYKQNQFGGSAGGPILKNKLFFFGDYEGLRVRQGNLIQGIVPTPAKLNGDFSASKTPIVNPLTGVAFPNNQVPQPLISQAAKVFNRYFPLPNASLANGTNYITAPSTVRNDDQFTARLDANLGPKDTMFGEQVYYNSSYFTPGIIPLAGSVTPWLGMLTTVQETHSLNANMMNVAKLAYERASEVVSWVHMTTNVNKAMGVQNLPDIPSLYGLPDMVITGYTNTGGEPFEGGGIQNVFSGSDEFSWVHGRHQMTFGADVRRIQFQFPAASFFNGVYEFFGFYSHNALADYLLGDPYIAFVQQIPDFDNFRQSRLSFFGQDNFRVTPRLTLNLGVRYEYNQPTYEINNKEGYFDSNLGKLVVRVPANYSSIPIPSSKISYDPSFQRGIWHPQYLNFAPRLGFAYSLSNSTVLRGGYGIFFTQTEGNQLQGKADILPFAYTATLVGNTSGAPEYTMSTLFPSLGTQAVGGVLSPFTVDPNDDRPYVQEWNFGVQHRFGSSFLLDTSYEGSKGTHLVERDVENQAVLPRSPTDITPLQSRRPLPNWGSILAFDYGESANYNALQVRAEKRLTSGLSFLVGYTWSHCLDSSTASDVGFSTTHPNTYDRAADYASCDNNLPQRFTASYTYELPFGTGRHFLSGVSSKVNKLVSGWQVVGITTFADGEGQSSITVNGDRSNTGATINRANEVADCVNNGNLPSSQRTLLRWFNTSCFVDNPLGTFGNSGRNIIHLPSTNNWDLSAIKDTPITEKVTGEFRAEFFSAFNHPNFILGTTTSLNRDNPQFGQITGAGGSREIQFALKFLW